MFIDFFYLLRGSGLPVTMDQWLCLMNALEMGLANSSLMEFYYLCRNILVNRESDYDKFDMAFAEYFKGVESVKDIPDELWNWLNQNELERDIMDKPDSAKEYDFDSLMQMFKERLNEQHEKHDGGNYWIGTGGTSPMGHGGYNPAGIRVGGTSRHQSAIKVAGERKFRDFRQDNTLDTRQFQMAFRKLREFSTRVDGEKNELDVEGTIDATCNNGGLLKIVYNKPRKNTVKLLLLIDSDGSMSRYSSLCNRLFHAVDQSTHLKDLKVLYFHNCIYDYLFTTPDCSHGHKIETDWALGNFGSEYKVIFVGDGAMSPYELLAKGGNQDWYSYNMEPGITWLKKFRDKYNKCIWLNPIKKDRWDWTYGAQTIGHIRNVFPMFELTLDGLDGGIKKLLSR
ncbi:MAG: VWA domain-containing protein [Eubacteriales bacterium]|nr:VWA domain-containing protein [Eubacteriales bacterium]